MNAEEIISELRKVTELLEDMEKYDPKEVWSATNSSLNLLENLIDRLE